MSGQVKKFLRHLREFLDKHPAKHDELQKLFAQILGAPLPSRTLEHYLAVTREPSFSNAIVLLRFMQINGQILAGSAQSGLFHYPAGKKAK